MYLQRKTYQDSQSLNGKKIEVLTFKVIEAQGVELGIEYRLIPPKNENLQTYLGKRLGDETIRNYVEIAESETAIDKKHVSIEYKSNEQAYYLKDNGSESGTFLKVQAPLKLIAGYIFAFGESSMAISYIEGMTITLKFLGGSKEGRTL